MLVVILCWDFPSKAFPTATCPITAGFPIVVNSTPYVQSISAMLTKMKTNPGYRFRSAPKSNRPRQTTHPKIQRKFIHRFLRNHAERKPTNLNKNNQQLEWFNCLLPLQPAIEYVAACSVSGAGGIFVRGSFARGILSPGVFWPGALLAGGLLARGIFVRGCFCPGFLLPGGTFVRGAYARSLQVQCVYAPSRLSVPSIVA